MQDNEVRRLEDRIEAVQRESQLRFDRMFERVDGAVARVVDQVSAIRAEQQTQRSEMLSVRREAQDAIEKAVSGFRDSLAEYRTEAREHYRWIIGTILATVISSALVIAGLTVSILLGGFQVWGIGVQVGQSAPIHLGSAMSSPEGTQPSAARQSNLAPPPTSAPPATQR